MSLDYLTIGRRIHRLRKRAAITQQMLAEKIGTSTAYISQLERGTKGISIENLVNIANALGVTVDTILGDSMRHFPQQPDSDFNEIMRDCSTFERRVLIESLRELKRILRETNNLIRSRHR